MATRIGSENHRSMTKFTALQGFFTLGGADALILTALGSIFLIGFVFWLWMLIDCLTNEPSEGNDKLIWVVVVFFGNVLGALVYFFVRRSERLCDPSS